MSISFEGLDKILTELAELGDKETIQKGLNKSCAIVLESAVKKAPKDTGALRRSLTMEVDGLEGKVFTPLEYAPYVEYGTGLFAEGDKGGRTDVPWRYQDDTGEWHTTKGQKPHPYLTPALEENRDKIIETFKEVIKND